MFSGAWNITAQFADSETELVEALQNRFKNSSDEVLSKTLVSVVKPSPQEGYSGPVVVVIKNGGGNEFNSAVRNEIFTVQVWAYDYNEAAHLAQQTEAIIGTITTENISRVWVETPNIRVDFDGEEELRFFTVGAYNHGNQAL